MFPNMLYLHSLETVARWTICIKSDLLFLDNLLSFLPLFPIFRLKLSWKNAISYYFLCFWLKTQTERDQRNCHKLNPVIGTTLSEWQCLYSCSLCPHSFTNPTTSPLSILKKVLFDLFRASRLISCQVLSSCLNSNMFYMYPTFISLLLLQGILFPLCTSLAPNPNPSSLIISPTCASEGVMSLWSIISCGRVFLFLHCLPNRANQVQHQDRPAVPPAPSVDNVYHCVYLSQEPAVDGHFSTVCFHSIGCCFCLYCSFPFT